MYLRGSRTWRPLITADYKDYVRLHRS